MSETFDRGPTILMCAPMAHSARLALGGGKAARRGISALSVFSGTRKQILQSFTSPGSDAAPRLSLWCTATNGRHHALAMKGTSLTGLPSLAGGTKTSRVRTLCTGRWGTVASSSCADPRWHRRQFRDLDHAAQTCGGRRSMADREPSSKSQEQRRENRCANLFSHMISPSALDIPAP